MPDKKFVDEMVKAHNEYRAQHQAQPLKHAQDLTDYAQKWADHLVATNSFQHSPCDLNGQRLGENIAMKYDSRITEFTGQDATDQWYSEVAKHTFGGRNGCSGTGHFTQVVWKGSKELGVGKAQDKSGKYIVVASYRPAGNMMGDYAENVLPPKDSKIRLPVQKEKESEKPFSSRFDEGRKGFEDKGATGGTEKRTVKTTTRTEGGVTKTIVEETIIKPDGSKVTTTQETTTTTGSGHFKGDTDLASVSLHNDQSKKDAKSKQRDSSSSDEDSKKKPQKMNDFIDDAVKVHNELRAKHGTGKLKHAKDLSAFAQKWAEHLASKDLFEHSDCVLNGERIGENVCCKWSSAGADYTGREACEQWYSEISKHDFSMEPRSLGSGHFTQMIWNGSKEMGIGKAKTSRGKCIVVANYRPAGNIVGNFVENVPPLKK